MIKLSGLICLRNGDSLDYCWREAIESILPVCDEVVVCDAESDDGTQESVRSLLKDYEKLKLCVYPWPHPKGDIEFYVKWIQFGRMHVKGDYLLHIDADEVISEHSQAVLASFKRLAKPTDRVSLRCHRFNFWKDAHHLIPHGVCLSHEVIRVAPSDVFMPSDGAHPMGNEIVSMAQPSRAAFYHYGFLRKPAAYHKKSRGLHEAFFNTYDKRLADVEQSEKWMEEIKDVEWTSRLLDFQWGHPKIMEPWLRERGHL